MYELEGVVKAYGSVRAVDGVDLKITHDAFVVVAGPSGSGKRRAWSGCGTDAS